MEVLIELKKITASEYPQVVIRRMFLPVAVFIKKVEREIHTKIVLFSFYEKEHEEHAILISSTKHIVFDIGYIIWVIKDSPSHNIDP